MPLGSSEAAWSRAPHRAIERDMPLDDAGPQGHGGARGGNARLVPRVSHRNAELLPEHGDDPQVQFLVIGRIGAAGVQQDQVLLADQPHGMVDLVEVAHARGDDHRPALRADVLQQAVVREAGRGDLVEGDVELLDEIDGRLIPAGSSHRIRFSRQ